MWFTGGTVCNLFATSFIRVVVKFFNFVNLLYRECYLFIFPRQNFIVKS